MLPWPLLYEVLRARFVRQPLNVERLRRALRRVAFERVEDSPYRERAFQVTIQSAIAARRSLSLVETVLRLMIEDPALRVDAMITYNAGDFFDSCRRRRIPIVRDVASLGAIATS